MEVEEEEETNGTKFTSAASSAAVSTPVAPATSNTLESTTFSEPVVVDAPFEPLPEKVSEPVQAIERPTEIEPTTEFEQIEEDEVAENQVDDSDEEMGSDFEMPALDVGDSDDDE